MQILQGVCNLLTSTVYIPVKSFWTVRFLCFYVFKEVSSAHQACFYLIEILKYFYYLNNFLTFFYLYFYIFYLHFFCEYI